MNHWHFKLWHVLLLYGAALLIGATTVWIWIWTSLSSEMDDLLGAYLTILAMLAVSANLFYRARRKKATDAV